MIKRTLERLFRYWGKPRAIRVDNGKPFGDPQRSSVTPLGLWLAGLGITLIVNPPRCPRLNAKVERMQATTARWAEIENCRCCAELQKKLDVIARLHREKYVARRLGQSRRVLYKALWKNPRPYHAHSFCVEKTYRYLQQVIFKRKVNKAGCLTFYAQVVYVGTAYKESIVNLCLDQRKKQFKITTQTGKLIGWLQADNFSAKNITALTVCKKRTLNCSMTVSEKLTQT